MDSQLNVLLVDDDANSLDRYSSAITTLGYKCYPARMALNAYKICKDNNIHIAIVDYNMPQVNGIEVGKILRNDYEHIVLIMLTAYADAYLNEAMEAGFDDYLIKPDIGNWLKIALNKARHLLDIRLQTVELRREVEQSYEFHSQNKVLIGNSTALEKAKEKAKKAASSGCNILITGQSGTGKELLARYIHQNGSTPKEPFVAINCGALPESLLENELFGHEKGAFTGACRQQKGKFELAGKGTLFLDEVNSCSLGLQIKLLRVISEREYSRVGGEEILKFQARLIAATNQDLVALIAVNSFRDDLYYRLKVVEIHMPELDKRREDIPILANHFLNFYATKYLKFSIALDQDVLNYLTSHPPKGNVRELENLIEQAVVLCDEKVIGAEYICPSANEAKKSALTDYSGLVNPDVEERLDWILLLHHIIHQCDIKECNQDDLKNLIARVDISELSLCEAVAKVVRNSDIDLLAKAAVRCKKDGRVINPAIDILMKQNNEGALKAWWRKNAKLVVGIIKITWPKYSVIVPDLMNMSELNLKKPLSELIANNR